MSSSSENNDKLKVFISSKMAELRDVREIVEKTLHDRSINAWVYESHAGARPENVVETSLVEVSNCNVYVGLFWKLYGEVTIQEYHHARSLGKPCFIYIRDKHYQREKMLEDFLHAEIYDPQKGVTYDYFDSAIKLGEQIADDIMAWLVRTRIRTALVSQEEVALLQAEVNRLRSTYPDALERANAAAKISSDLEAIREQIILDPTRGAKALSNYIASHPNWISKRSEVDLRRAELRRIQQEVDLFGTNEYKESVKNRVIYLLLELCQEMQGNPA